MTRPLYIYFISQNRSHSAGPVIAIISNHTVLPVRGRSLHGIVDILHIVMSQYEAGLSEELLTSIHV